VRGATQEETAHRTNVEAATEIARQLRLRDLGGLIVIDFIDMEESKNQRAVENKLKDALHYDRARVQMGKISRFGLMELSRQRLRPALSEGSHITCPRCNGVGVIRDTESSALHILRIIQEEAMKENTAAIHAQVPVDAATYLLNEKRADIAKLEARLRVSIVLIPNKYLETPHYKVERLRHDDERLDLAKASYERAESPAVDTPYAAAAAAEKAKPRQEAVVRGIVHETPAPVVAPPPAVAPAPAPVAAAAPSPRPSFLGRLWSLVTGRAEPEQIVAAPAPAPAAAEGRPPRPEKPERGADRGRDRRGGRGGRSDRGERGERREREGAEGRGEGKPARAPQDAPRQQGAEAAAAGAERRERADRRERPARPPREKPAEPGAVAPIEAAASAVTTIPAQVSALIAESPASGAEDAAAVEERRRRRGRRRRGGRGGRGEAEGREATAGEGEAVAPVDESVPAQGELEVSAPPEQEAVAEPAAVTEPPRSAAPIIVPPAVAPAPMPVEELRPVLEHAGLTLVQTQPAKLADVLARFASEEKPVRVPRERPVLPPLDTGPLVQVETRPPAAPSQH
jgi:ribonuclease E